MMRELVPACFILSVVVSLVSYQRGYEAAKTKADADQAWVNQQMEKAGFCAWVRQSSFANHCARIEQGGAE